MASLGKALLVQFALFLAVLLSSMAFASPNITNVSFSPSDSLWLGENLSVSVSCSESNASNSIAMRANLTGPSIRFTNVAFQNQAGFYQFTFNNIPYLSYAGSYALSIECYNSANESFVSQNNLSVSNLSGRITEISPTAIYTDNNIKIYFDLKNGDQSINNTNCGSVYLAFAVYLDDVWKQHTLGYFSGKGWELSIDPQGEGLRTIKVAANYSRMSVSDSSQKNIYSPINFSISSIDKTTLKSSDNITISFYAYDRGNPIIMDSGFSFDISEGDVQNIAAITRSGGVYTTKLAVSRLAPNPHTLSVNMRYNGADYAAYKTVYCMIPISGKIVDGAEKPVSAELEFFSNSEKNLSFKTDSTGSYSSSIQPGIYDINMKFPKATLFMQEAFVDSFVDPVKYDYMESGSITGLNSIAAFNFEFANDFEKANIDMSYNEKLIDDERNLKVFACYAWSNRKCNSNWTDAEFTQDTVRNTVSVYTSELSAFAIGTRQDLTLAANLDRESYYLNEDARISGIVYGPGDSRVSGAVVRASISGILIKFNATSGDSGEFIITFPIGIPEGNYTLTLSAEKSPFGKSSISRVLEVLKKREVLINAPSSIRVSRGNVLNQEIEIMNTGQVKLTNVSLAILGIPSEWFAISQYSDSLDVNDKAKATIFFNIPESANASTTSATLTFSSAELKEEKKMGFTVISNETQAQQPAATEPNSPSGSFLDFTLPKISYEYTLAAAALAVIAVIAVTFKPKGKGRDEIKSALSEVKSYLDIRMKKDNKYNFTEQKDYQEKRYQRADRGLVNG